jgi:L-ascorbate metabolism protein UlaG (beta-lactamase superfamily)
MIWLLAIPAILLTGLLLVDLQISASGYDGPESDHFDGKKFHNPDKIRGRGLFDMMKWALSGDRGEWTELRKQDVTFAVPSQTPENKDEFCITFVNHTTALIQVDGLNILTDPVWSRRVSPYSWVGPGRMRPPGIRFEDLPEIDLVLISHNHYDHLDIAAVKRLKQDHDPQFITPLGVAQYLNKNGISRTADMDWWEEHEFSAETMITGVPAQHFSGRGVFDRDQTLWCGYVLQTKVGTLYFAGDTAYGSFFTDIGSVFDIDLSLIPIGAYKPRWFMQPIHTDPNEAVRIHQDVQSSQSIATHFGTFPLADDAMDEPKQDLARALNKHGVPAADFITLDEGEERVFLPSVSKAEAL